jgi:hypothetical protein
MRAAIPPGTGSGQEKNDPSTCVREVSTVRLLVGKPICQFLPLSFLAPVIPHRFNRDRGGNEICVRVTQGEQPVDLHRFWDGVITSSQNLSRLRNEATALRNRQEFQRARLTELGNTDFESWAKESFEIATKIAYRNGAQIGIPKGGNKDCRDVQAAPVLPVGYVVNASRIADRRMILGGYRLADFLTRVLGN